MSYGSIATNLHFFLRPWWDALQAWPVVFLEVVPLRNVWLRCWDLRRVATVAVSVLGAPPLRWLRWLDGKWGWLFSQKKIIPLEYEALFKWIVSSGKIHHDTVDDEKIHQTHQLRLVTGHLSLRCPFIDQQQHVCLIWSMMSIFLKQKTYGGSYAIITFC